MSLGQQLSFRDFVFQDVVSLLGGSPQSDYLACYLADLGATTVVEEPTYFDRDFLAEFSVFYSTSARGYPNICRRLHFFSGKRVTRNRLSRALAGGRRVIASLQNSYLGFVVLRPIPAAPLGRTVLRWYDEQTPATPRVTKPSRDYICHLAGLSLKVHGLAWQQQDSAVGACATVGVWTMLHSSAFDDHHAIPTTAEITRAAHRTASLGSRIFPSSGLNIYQLAEAIKEHGLAPIILDGDTRNQAGASIGFRRDRFAASLAAFIRSGYPVLIGGKLGGIGHAVCAVGFRETLPATLSPGSIDLYDSNIEHIYIHDDNLGPSARFRIDTDPSTGIVHLKTDPPPRSSSPSSSNPTLNYPEFVPERIIVAVHNELRTSPDALHRAGFRRTQVMSAVIADLMKLQNKPPLTLLFSSRFITLANYLGEELERTLGPGGAVLAKTRLALQERVPPMSLHLGVVRVGVDNATPLFDVLYDTTDSDRHHPTLAAVCFNKGISIILSMMTPSSRASFGVTIEAY